MYPKSLLSGLLGAVAVTALNESLRRFSSKAPRLDKLGIDAATKALAAAGISKPAEGRLFRGTMLADILANALYYSLISLAGRHAKSRWLVGSGLGLAAGLGAVVLPEPLQLDPAPTNRSKATKVMTVAWYMAGALLATGIISLLSADEEQA